MESVGDAKLRSRAHCRLRFPVIFGILFGLLGSVDAMAASAIEEGLRTDAVLETSSGPIWASQATWDLEEQHLVVPDPGSAKIYVFDAGGEIVERIARPGRGPLDLRKPYRVHAIGRRYLVRASFYRLVWLNARFESEEGVALGWDDEEEGDYRLLSPKEAATDGTTLFLLGNVQHHDRTTSGLGLFTVPLKDSRGYRSLGELAVDGAERSYYSSPPDNLVVCGGDLYFLRMEATLSIQRVTEGRQEKLESFPESFRDRPRVHVLGGRESVLTRRAAIRNAKLADGLFCLEDRWLLLLAHRPRREGGLEWLVYPIEPERDAIGDAIELPTHAGEILFVPGLRRWAVFEKTPLREVGNQPLARLVTFSRPGPEGGGEVGGAEGGEG